MNPLTRLVLASASRTRTLVVVLGTAAISGLLLTATAVVRLGVTSSGASATTGMTTDGRDDFRVFMPLQEAGTRGGVALGIVLVAVPILALLVQVLDFGAVRRERRNAALVVVGATSTDLRRWGAVEIGVPASVGALAGVAVWWLLRQFLGRDLADTRLGGLVPAIGPGWWGVPVVVAVGALGAAIGGWLRAQGRADGLTGPRNRGLPDGRRRFRGWWWTTMVIVVAVPVTALLPGDPLPVPILLVPVCAAVAVAALTPGVVRRSAGLLGRGTPGPARLLAARRLRTDTVACAGAAISAGAGGLAVGVCTVFLVDVDQTPGLSGAFDYRGPAVVVLVLTGLALVMVGVSLTIHVADTLLTHRHAYAQLWAAGVPRSTLGAALRWQVVSTITPVTALGVVLGSLVYGGVLQDGSGWWTWALVALGATVVVSVLVAVLAISTLTPVVRRTIDVQSLRTE